MTDPAPNAVGDWYDRNTRWFLRVGRKSAESGAIHRALWDTGVTTELEAVRQANVLVQEAAAGGGPMRLLDLGCGVGGSLCQLMDALPDAQGVGITLSASQVALATARTKERGLTERCQFVQGDFAFPPDSVRGPFDLAFAIEAFVHSPDPRATIAAAHDLLAPGGTLVLIDDFLAKPVQTLPEADQAIVNRFRTGWQAHGLSTPEAVSQWADAVGFDLAEDRDLTPVLRLWRPRDRWVAFWVGLLGPLFGSHPYVASLVGGDALQRALSGGLIHYRKLVFRRR